MMIWYPPLNDLSDLTWHMFTHVVETNQHSVKMIVMWYDDMVSSSECSSGLTWYMFMHVVESKPT